MHRIDCGTVKQGVGVSKKSEMVHNFFINKATELIFIYLKSGCNKMCSRLIFVKINNFEHFSDVLLNFLNSYILP